MKGFIKRLALWSDVVNSKSSDPATKGDLALSQIMQVLLLHGVGKMKTKGIKLLNH